MSLDVAALDPGTSRQALKELAAFLPSTQQRPDFVRDWADEAAIVRAEMRRRGQNYQNCLDSEEARAQAYRAAKMDPVGFINDWVFTYDPRARSPLPKTMPFKLWPKQVELVIYIVSLIGASQSGAVKKSRDIGASWIAAAVAVWLFTFYPETAIGFGSNLERNVDRRGDPKSLFWKVRFILHRLPTWMRPPGWRIDGDHDNNLRIINPDNGSTIIGEGGRQMGRSGRYTVYFLDEWAWVTYAEELWGGLADTTDVLIPISTSRGAGTHFWKIEQQKRVAFFYFKWDADPRKDEQWAAAKRDILGETRFAIEHSMDDYAATDRQIIPAQWAMAATMVSLEGVRQPEHGQIGIDVGDGGDETVATHVRGLEVVAQPAWGTELSQEVYSAIAKMPDKDRQYRLVVDKIGVGAGLAAAVEPMAKRGVNPEHVWERVANGQKVPEHWHFPDAELKPIDRFKDYATAAWWWLRLRLEQTYRYSIGEDYDASMLLVIPDDPVLIAQLTSRRYVEQGDYIRLMSKKEMAREGLGSPDRAESLVYATAPRLTPAGQVNTDRAVINKASKASRLFNGGW